MVSLKDDPNLVSLLVFVCCNLPRHLVACLEYKVALRLAQFATLKSVIIFIRDIL